MRTVLLCIAILVLCAPPVDAKGSASGGKSAKSAKSKGSKNRTAGNKRGSKGRRGKRPRRGSRRRRGTRAHRSAKDGRKSSRRRSKRQSSGKRKSMAKREKALGHDPKVRFKETFTTANGTKVTKISAPGGPKKYKPGSRTGQLIRSGSVSNNGILNAENAIATVKAAESLAKINKLSSGRGG